MVQRAKNEPEGRCRRKAHILVVDDVKPILEMAQCILTDEGYSVTTCSSGAAAGDVYSESHEDIALVILDMVMPKMSGPEVFAELRVVAPNAPVLLSSGYSQDQKAEAVLKQGAAGFIQKPFGLAALANKLRKVLDEK